jgi:hypothetical protein
MSSPTESTPDRDPYPWEVTTANQATAPASLTEPTDVEDPEADDKASPAEAEVTEPATSKPPRR